MAEAVGRFSDDVNLGHAILCRRRCVSQGSQHVCNTDERCFFRVYLLLQVMRGGIDGNYNATPPVQLSSNYHTVLSGRINYFGLIMRLSSTRSNYFVWKQ
eukprot:scaffold31704_cov61-Phaeocystis_antarctica.AAC.1